MGSDMITHIKQKSNGNAANKVFKDSKGFTLLEVIMAISILTIGILAVASMQALAIRGNAISRVYTESTDRAQDMAEKLLSSNLADAKLSDADGDGVAGLNDTGANADHSDTSHSKYAIYWNVVSNWAGGSAETGVNTVRVIVTWTERGIQKSHSYDFLKNRL